MKASDFNISVNHDYVRKILGTNIINLKDTTYINNKDKPMFSKIIESIFLQIPLPSVYMIFNTDEFSYIIVENHLKNYNVLNVIYCFINNGFQLKDISFLKEYENKYFNELPEWLKCRILDTIITVNILQTNSKNTMINNSFVERIDLYL